MESATQPFQWPGFPYPALVTTSGIAAITTVVIIASHYFDHTGGLLTLSLTIVFAFVAVTIAAIIYPIPTNNPIVDILMGGLTTSLGGIVGFWMSGRNHRRPGDGQG